MAKKKRAPGKNSAAEQAPGAPPDDELSFLPDQRALEGVMRQVLGGIGDSGGDTPLARAQEVMYQAFDAEENQQVPLARKALDICPDCADAYVLLAENAATLDEAVKLYEEGVAAGERAIGKGGFQQYEGHFWDFLETRPYMRAREGLAQCLWEAGRCEEAVGHYQEMLRLNPNDNQGIRYALAACLLDLDRDDDLARLLTDYEKDATADWTYSMALLAFRQEGDSPRARQMLSKARKSNKHVVAYLLGHKNVPRYLPEYITFGGEEEAMSYAYGFRKAWMNTPGAITWLRKTLKVPLPEPPRQRKPSWPQLRLQLHRLPWEESEVWQVDARQVPAEEGEDPQAVAAHPWMLVVISGSENHLLGFEFFDEEPSARNAWDYLLEVMVRPKQGDPRRPGRIEILRDAPWTLWPKKLKQLDIELLLCDQLEQIDHLLEQGPLLAKAIRQLTETPLPSGHGSADELAELPQAVGEIWQADVRLMPTWITGEGEPFRPWVALVINRSDDLVLMHQLQAEPPPPDWLWPATAGAICQPVVGSPHRPGVIEVATPQQRDVLRPRLEQAGIECVVCERLEQLDVIFDEMVKHLCGPETLRAVIDVPGVRPAQVGSFFAAAADFYRKKPWRHVPGDTPVKIVCDNFQSGPWYAVVMGQSGVTQGLAVYEDFAALRVMLDGNDSDEENSRKMSSLSVLFSEAFEISVRDLDAAEKHGWPVAGPEAYPLAIRVNPGRAVRPPLAWELELLDGCLRTIPDFLLQQSAEQACTVPVSSGKLAMRLSRLEGV